MVILELGPEVGQTKKKLPAVLVAANMHGNVPISTEAALSLIQQIVDQADVRKDKTWYIIPIGNPDAAWNYFKKPLKTDTRNSRPYNDDKDDRIDEDGTDDLDGNGIITTMRVKSPNGQWMPVEGEPRLMKRADWIKGEKGVYKLYTEGIDNDEDGEYNEDGPGGVNIGINFPHLFHFFTATGGTWAGSEAETYNLFKFVFQHPEIAMTISFGDDNFCLNPPRSGRRETGDYSKIKIPKFIASEFGYDADKTYTMEEIMEKAKEMVPPDFELTESMVAGFLGLGAAANPQPEDLKFYTEISDQYKEFLKKNKMEQKRLDPAEDKDGSFELWSYYQLGVPSFALDFWTPPKPEEKKEEGGFTPDKLEAMSNDDFIALGEEKIDAFLKSSGAPGGIKAKMIIEMVKSGQMTTKKMAEMMRQMPKPKSSEGADQNEKAILQFSDKELQGKGFVDWKTFKHPTLGEVEIGGFAPFLNNTPPASLLDSLLKSQTPWVFELAKKLPCMKIAKTEVKNLESGIYRVKVWVENTGYLPYPTAMGERNQQIPPVVITLKGEGIKIIDGKPRSFISKLRGHDAGMVQWLIHTAKPVQLHIDVSTPSAWSDTKTISIEPGPGGAK